MTFEPKYIELSNSILRQRLIQSVNQLRDSTLNKADEKKSSSIFRLQPEKNVALIKIWAPAFTGSAKIETIDLADYKIAPSEIKYGIEHDLFFFSIPAFKKYVGILIKSIAQGDCDGDLFSPPEIFVIFKLLRYAREDKKKFSDGRIIS